MSFYAIKNSINNKIVGNYNQVVNAIHHCDVWEDPKFIDRIDFIKINFEPITSNAILEKKAKLTDLINVGCVGFGLRLLISEKLKKILEIYSIDKCQFFKSPVVFKNEKIEDYWIVNPYLFNVEFVNYKKSTIIVRVRNKNGGSDKKKLEVSSIDEFTKLYNFYKDIEEMVTISNIYLYDNIKDDFFMLRHVEGGIKYIVSEKLKQEIEDAGCTGIEFQPIELSLNEWLLSGGEREKVYGKA